MGSVGQDSTTGCGCKTILPKSCSIVINGSASAETSHSKGLRELLVLFTGGLTSTCCGCGGLFPGIHEGHQWGQVLKCDIWRRDVDTIYSCTFASFAGSSSFPARPWEAGDEQEETEGTEKGTRRDVPTNKHESTRMGSVTADYRNTQEGAE